MSVRRAGAQPASTRRGPRGSRPLRRWLEAMWDDALARLARLAEAEEAPRRGPRADGRRARAGAVAASERRRGNAQMEAEKAGLDARRRAHGDDRGAAGDGVPLLHRLGSASPRGGARARRSTRGPAGRSTIRYPNGVVAGGGGAGGDPAERDRLHVRLRERPSRSSIGASRVTITPRARAGAGRVCGCATSCRRAAAREVHVQGWRYQLAVFANVVALHEPTPASTRSPTASSRLWAETDAAKRRADARGDRGRRTLVFRDPYSCTRGPRRPRRAHRGRAAVHARRRACSAHGEARQCQGTALVDWVVEGRRRVGARGTGTNVFDLAADGRIARVTGLWG